MPKLSKGTIVVDEGVKREYAKIAQEEGWNVILIPQSHRNIGLSDRALAEKYTKNIHPIFTNDKTSYKESSFISEKNSRFGYILHEFVKPEEEELYREQIKIFFSTYSEKYTHGVVWIIRKLGKATKKKIEIIA